MTPDSILAFFKLYPRVLNERRIKTLSPEAFRAWIYMMAYMNDQADTGWEEDAYKFRAEGETHDSTGATKEDITWWTGIKISDQTFQELEQAQVIHTNESNHVCLPDWERMNLRVFSDKGSLLKTKDLTRKKK